MVTKTNKARALKVANFILSWYHATLISREWFGVKISAEDHGSISDQSFSIKNLYFLSEL